MNTDLFHQALQKHDKKLFGRDKETAELRSLFLQAVSEKRPRAIFVHGYGGSGKSKLIHHSLRTTSNSALKKALPQGWIFAEGKYDQQRTSRPYSALTDAGQSLCLSLLQSESDQRPAAVDYLEEHLAQDFHLLVDLIPQLGQLLPGCYRTFLEHNNNSDNSNFNHALQFDRLKTAFQTLLAGISQFLPVVLHLDDLQWCDGASLSILEGLIFHVEQPCGFLLVASYRDNELVLGHALFGPLQRLETAEASNKLHVADLSLESLNAFVADLLRHEDHPDQTLPLSRAVHQRTHGNIFFVVEFLQLLVTNDILSYSFAYMKWQWDMTKVTEQTQATENVTDLVIRRMRRLPIDTSLALIVASQLGNRFEAHIVKAILKQWKVQEKKNSKNLEHSQEWKAGSLDIGSLDDSSNAEALSYLDIPIQEGFIVPVDSASTSQGAWYRFQHDRIQQAASEFIADKAEMDALRLRLGTLLLDARQRSGSTGTTWITVSAVDILNSTVALISSDERKLELAQANRDAAKIAVKQSAFFAGAAYLEQSRSLLMNEEKMWTEYYDLSLSIFTLSAELEFRCGKLAQVYKLGDKVKRNRRKPEDSMPISYIMFKALGSEAKYNECIDLAYGVLNETGFAMPMNGASPDDVGAVYGAVVQELSTKTNESIVSMQDAPTDEATTIMWKIFSSAVLFVWHADRPLDFAFLCCSMALKTLQTGLSPYSAQAFAVQAAICVSNKDFPNAKRMYNLYTDPGIVRRFRGHDVEAGTMVACYAPSGHVFCPLTKVDAEFLQGYEAGMKTGSLEWAMAATGCYLLTHFFSGLPLKIFVTESRQFIAEMKQYGNKVHRPMCEMKLQVALNLVGEGDGQPHILNGEALQEYNMRPILDGCEPGLAHTAMLAQLMLAYYFDEYDLAAEMAVKQEETGAMDLPMVWSVPYPYWRGLAYVGKVRSLQSKKSWPLSCGWLGKRKEISFYFAKAKDQLSTLETFAENGMINTIHMYKILQAEIASITPRTAYDEVVGVYLEGIRSATRSGFRQDAALGYEKLGLYIKGRKPEAAGEYLQTAVEMYTKWGAQAKADELQLTHLSAGASKRKRGKGSSLVHSFVRDPKSTLSSGDLSARRVTLTRSLCQ